jgi:hypothetical protein
MILLISVYEYEGSTTDVIDWLNYKDINFINANGKDFYEFASIKINNDSQDLCVQIEGNKHSLLDVNTVWLRRWFDYDKGLQNINFGLGDDENKNLRKKILIEFKSLTKGLLFILEQQINYWLTYPNTSSPNKLISLLAAKSAGLKIPKTIVTGSKKTLKKQQVSENIITKNIGEAKTLYQAGKGFSTYTSIVEKTFIDKLPEKFTPSKFQENIDKVYEIRSFILENEIYSMAIFSQLDSQTATDFRQYNKIKPNRNVPINYQKALKKSYYFLCKK